MKIIFKNEDNSIGVIIPSQEVLTKYTMKQIADKDVPSGLEYVIVEDSVVPSDRTFRGAWEWGFDASDGVGSDSNEFKEA